MKSKIHELLKANYFSVSKKILITVLVMAGISATAQVKVGNNPTVVNASAILEMESTNKGLLLPRMTTAQRTAIVLPAAGLQVFDTDTDTVWFHNGTVWVNSTPAGGTSKWTNDLPNTRVFLTNQSNGINVRPAGTEFVVGDNGNVGIGTVNTGAAKVSVLETALNATKTVGLSTLFRTQSVLLGPVVSGINNTLETDAADATNKGILLGNHTGSFHKGTGTVAEFRALSGSVLNQSTGIITDGKGANITVSNRSTGTITTATAVSSAIDNTNAGTITNARGLFNTIVNNTGSIGTMTSARNLEVNVNTGATGTIANARSMYSVINNSSPNTMDTAYGFDSNLINSNTGSITDARGFDNNVSNQSTGTITTARGMVSTLSNSGAGTIGNATALQTDVSTGATGTITNARAINSTITNKGTATTTLANGFENLVENTNSGIITNARGITSGIANNGAGSIAAATGLDLYKTQGTNATAIDISEVLGTAVGVGIRLRNNLTGTSQYAIFSETTAPSSFAGRIGIGTTAPNASAVLDLTSTTAGFLLPRMTTVQRNAIATPATGLMVYNTNTTGLEYFDGVNWNSVSSNSSSSISTKTANYTFGVADKTILMNCTTGPLTVTLPAVATSTGRTIVVSKIDTTANALTFSSAVRTNLSTTLASVNFSTSLTLQSDGTNWWVIARN